MTRLQVLRRSIARKFGALYALLFGLIAGIGGVVVFQMKVVQHDAEILLEETREHVIARDILSLLEDLEASLAPPAAARQDDATQGVLETLGHIRSEFRSLAQRKNDPSREEHQDREDRLLERLQADLGELDAALRTQVDPRPVAGPALGDARQFLSSLIAETRQEVQLADEDMERAGTRTTRVMALTVAAALLLLGASLVLVFRGVIDPVRKLREGARRLGGGDLGHRIDLDNTDELGALAHSFNDMAERVAGTHAELEERVAARTREFIRAARLADLGVLAAGVAHEINTPLASISACAEGLQRRRRKGELDLAELDEYLAIVGTEARRAKDITTRLLALARQEPDEASEFELGLVVDHVEKAARPQLERAGVALEVEMESPGTRVVGNTGELTQICMNLLTNAADASEVGSTVRLACRVEEQSLVIEVADHGHGIPPEDLDRVFEPFYTTKTSGRGTGLGLALVEAMVQARGGRISVESEVGAGTRFRVVLPLVWRSR